MNFGDFAGIFPPSANKANQANQWGDKIKQIVCAAQRVGFFFYPYFTPF